ncbi:MAG: tRNA-dihydrouridine synthase family protein [Salinivirgaceae bacterium]|jgi:tRNA-dihydrouridine synthase|nr:tRNA-dihydrouridine synthase family protein [Salinivirgaceae bacterium]
MSSIIHASPLQGFTDFRFRNAIQQFVGGVDHFYAPYIRLNGSKPIKKSQRADLLPENNVGYTVVPQVLTADAVEFLHIIDFVKELGYSTLNWNLGCPYPMVTKRGMGAGLLSYPEKIEAILTQVFAQSEIKLSVKLRSGYADENEVFSVLQVLEQFPVTEIALHPRMGKQLYKGTANVDVFEACLGHTSHKLIYNGDITTVSDWRLLQSRFPDVDEWMIGRGIIMNPFLPQMIKTNSEQLPDLWRQTFSKFHDTLLRAYAEQLSGHAHLIMKMYQFWQYFIHLFPEHSRLLKKIKKSKSTDDYMAVVRRIITEPD